MKTLRNLFVIFIFVISTVFGTFAEAEQKFDEIGSYKIEKSECLKPINGIITQNWNLKYDSIDQPFVVTMFKSKDCKDFVVRTFGFEIQYTCNGSVFGVKYVDERYSNVSLDNVLEKLNRESFLHQSVILSGKGFSDDYLVSIIACYLPELLKHQS